MKFSTTYKLFWLPIFIIGVVLMILGSRWMFVEKPWLLDQVANEEILGMSFNELFSNEINSTLPDYLRTIYRFFGLWVTFIGVLLICKLFFYDLNDFKARNVIHSIIGVLLSISLYLGHTKIPNSPFIFLMWFFVIIYLTSIYSSIKIKSNV